MEYRKDNHCEVSRGITHVVVVFEVSWLKFGAGKEGFSVWPGLCGQVGEQGEARRVPRS